MSETNGVINQIKYTVNNYSGDIMDLEWSTEQIQTLLSELEKVQRELKHHCACVFDDEHELMDACKLHGQIQTELERVLSDRKLCPECLQMLELDESCLTCQLRKALEKEKKRVKELEKELLEENEAHNQQENELEDRLNKLVEAEKRRQKMIIGIKAHFDAAHYLPDYPGKCKEMHGHTWAVEVEVKGLVNEEDGMVLDLAKLKLFVNAIINPFDHHVLNTWFKIPTCENIATYIKECLETILAANLTVSTIKVQEGDGGWAIV